MGDILATLNLDVSFDTAVGVSALVINRVLADLPRGLDHSLTEGYPPVLVSGFTIIFCLASALVWGALLIAFRLFLLAKKGAPSFLNYVAAGLLVAVVPLFFNGLRPMVLGVLAILTLKTLAAYELSLHTKGLSGDYLIGELGHLNLDGRSRKAKEGGCLALLNLGGLFPLARWGRYIGPSVSGASRRLTVAAVAFQLFYQGLWYNKKYRRTRKKIRRCLESPIRLRRYWYLNVR